MEVSVGSEFLEKYLEKGFRNIIILDHDFKETASGHEEWTNETAVAKKGKKFVKIELHEHLRFLGGPPPGGGLSIESEGISEKEFQKLAGKRSRIDTEEALDKLEAQKKRLEQSTKLHERFMKTAPDCPRCGKHMVNRRGPRGEFWGCRDYPECKGTANFSPESRKRFAQYMKR